MGFTLTEVLIVLIIVGVLSIIGGISLNSRMRTSRLESAAEALKSDVSYARTSALFKSCPTRFIFCENKSCQPALQSETDDSNGYMTKNSAFIRYYAIIRMSHADTGVSNCYNANAIAESNDGFEYWDFDRRPQALPIGVAFTNIFGSGVVATSSNAVSDWSSSTSGAASNTIWFSSSNGSVNVPSGSTDSTGNTIALQVGLDDCDPGDASEECGGYFITVGSGGVVNMRKCIPGSRSSGSDTCY